MTTEPLPKLLQDLLRASAAEYLAGADTCEKISSRRGAEVWKLHASSGNFRVKVAVRTDDGQAPATASLYREHEVLEAVEDYRTSFRPRLAKIGSDGEAIPCLTTLWVDGTPGVSILKDSHDAPEQIREVQALFRCVAALHAAGWAHGDLQPAHFRRQANGEMLLLDLGLAQSEQRPFEGYKGGLVHFNAPEVCSDVLAGKPARATSRSDVFSVASLVHFAVTGKVLGDYSLEDSWEDMLRVLASCTFRTTELETHLVGNRRLFEMLVACLSCDPSGRPAGAKEAVALLGHKA